MWRFEKLSDSVPLVFEDHRVGVEAFESKPDPVEIGFNYHAETISPFLSREIQRMLPYSLTDSSRTVYMRMSRKVRDSFELVSPLSAAMRKNFYGEDVREAVLNAVRLVCRATLLDV